MARTNDYFMHIQRPKGQANFSPKALTEHFVAQNPHKFVRTTTILTEKPNESRVQ